MKQTLKLTAKLGTFIFSMMLVFQSEAQTTWVPNATHINNANTGYVGIKSGGTLFTPVALFEVQNGSVLFDGATGATPINGAGVRMMWVPGKRAFRAGYVTSTQWDDTNIGTCSFASCFNSKATGTNSFAANYLTTASGNNSFAVNYVTTASGNNSAAFGTNTTSQAFSSFVIGSFNYNPGNYDPASWVLTEPLFVIGNGSSSLVTSNAMTVFKNGKVLIGTPNLTSFVGVNTAGNYLLYVQQGILTEQVKVAVCTTSNWADYVFDGKYKLKTIKELETFVKTEKHLPNVPSAEDVVKDGIDMATMDAKLLEKIEELTLYIIEQNKRIEALEKK